MVRKYKKKKGLSKKQKMINSAILSLSAGITAFGGLGLGCMLFKSPERGREILSFAGLLGIFLLILILATGGPKFEERRGYR